MKALDNLSQNQKLVFDILQQSNKPLSAYTILDILRNQGFRAPLQVYRALDKLIELGLVHRLESMSAFIACSHADMTCSHNRNTHEITAFTICNQCGTVTEFSDCDINDSIKEQMHAQHFVPHVTMLEIRGICKDCKENQ